MINIIMSLGTTLAVGGAAPIIIILLLIIGYLIYDRIKLVKSLSDKDEKIYSIIENYYNGNLSIAEAMNGLKLVLAEIKAKI